MPASSEATVRLPDEVDLHARPASEFVRAAMGFSSSVRIAANGREVDAKSMLGVLSLGARRGTELALTATGVDAEAATAGLVALVEALEE